MSVKTIKLALVGGGMFGRDVVLRSLADFERNGIVPYLATAGLDHHARDLGPVEYKTVAVGTRTARTSENLTRDYAQWVPGSAVKPYHGEAPWEPILDELKPDILLVATPDSLHTAPIMAALERGVHVVAEKPLTLDLEEARTIVNKSREVGLVVAVDMHKRYDAFLRSAFVDVAPRIGEPVYGRAVLEEPLEVSTEIFKWATSSNPFSYVGCHWTDLFGYYLGVTPVALHAVGQKKLLVGWKDDAHPKGINTFDAMQVNVQYDNGMNVTYVNNWINPADFEGNVNQEMELVGTRGRVFVDQQDRGMRLAITGEGSRTNNPHFQSEVIRAGTDGDRACVGYCKDALTAGVDAASRVILKLTDRVAIADTYADAESGMLNVAILDAAAQVAARNHEHLQAGRGAPVTARFTDESFEIIDPAQ